MSNIPKDSNIWDTFKWEPQMMKTDYLMTESTYTNTDGSHTHSAGPYTATEMLRAREYFNQMHEDKARYVEEKMNDILHREVLIHGREMRGSIDIGSVELEKPTEEKETPVEELQYFDPKDLDI